MTSYGIPETLVRASSLSKCTLFVLPFHRVNVLRWVLRVLRGVNCRVRFISKLLYYELKCHVTSYSRQKMLTKAFSLSQYTLFVLPFHTVNVLRWVLRGIETS